MSSKKAGAVIDRSIYESGGSGTFNGFDAELIAAQSRSEGRDGA